MGEYNRMLRGFLENRGESEGTEMMGTRERMRSGDEYDALTRRGRRALKLFWKAGIASRTKSRFWRRIRRETREQLHQCSATSL